jgi:hypothetical protein
LILHLIDDRVQVTPVRSASTTIHRKEKDMAIVAILVIAAIFGTAGYFIGRPKGRAVEGAVWGALLGAIGLIVIALRKAAN